MKRQAIGKEKPIKLLIIIDSTEDRLAFHWIIQFDGLVATNA